MNQKIFKIMSYIEYQAKTIKKTAKKLKLENCPDENALYEIYGALQNIQNELRVNNLYVTYPVSASPKIDCLNLSHRAWYALRRANINIINDLTQKTEPQVLRLRNVGEKTLKEILAKLKEKGLSLKTIEEEK